MSSNLILALLILCVIVLAVAVAGVIILVVKNITNSSSQHVNKPNQNNLIKPQNNQSNNLIKPQNTTSQNTVAIASIDSNSISIDELIQKSSDFTLRIQMALATATANSDKIKVLSNELANILTSANSDNFSKYTDYNNRIKYIVDTLNANLAKSKTNDKIISDAKNTITQAKQNVSKNAAFASNTALNDASLAYADSSKLFPSSEDLAVESGQILATFQKFTPLYLDYAPKAKLASECTSPYKIIVGDKCVFKCAENQLLIPNTYPQKCTEYNLMPYQKLDQENNRIVCSADAPANFVQTANGCSINTIPAIVPFNGSNPIYFSDITAEQCGEIGGVYSAPTSPDTAGNIYVPACKLSLGTANIADNKQLWFANTGMDCGGQKTVISKIPSAQCYDLCQGTPVAGITQMTLPYASEPSKFLSDNNMAPYPTNKNLLVKTYDKNSCTAIQGGALASDNDYNPCGALNPIFVDLSGLKWGPKTYQNSPCVMRPALYNPLKSMPMGTPQPIAWTNFILPPKPMIT